MLGWGIDGQAYQKNCKTYEELLETVVAVDEEIIFSSASHRLDYFKTAIDWWVTLGYVGVEGEHSRVSYVMYVLVPTFFFGCYAFCFLFHARASSFGSFRFFLCPAR